MTIKDTVEKLTLAEALELRQLVERRISALALENLNPAATEATDASLKVRTDLQVGAALKM